MKISRQEYDKFLKQKKARDKLMKRSKYEVEIIDITKDKETDSNYIINIKSQGKIDICSVVETKEEMNKFILEQLTN